MALGVDGIGGLPAVIQGRSSSVVDPRQLADPRPDGARPQPERLPPRDAGRQPADRATGAAGFPVRSAFARDAGGFLAQTIAQEVLRLPPAGPGPRDAVAAYRATPAGPRAEDFIAPSARIDESI